MPTSKPVEADASRTIPLESCAFGLFELELGTGELRRAGRPVHLAPQPTRVLVALVERAGRVVTRDELKQAVWGGETFVDFEQGLNFCIKEIRAALGDDAENPRFVETVPRRGYRLIAPVDRKVPSPERMSKSAGSADRARGPARAAVALIVAAALLAGVGAGYLGWWRTRRAVGSPAKAMIAVLPFENLSGDRDQNYFSDGFTEELISQLGRIDPVQLGVIARTSTQAYRDTTKGATQIGTELGVQHLVEGTVRRSGERVRITAQLIRVSDQSHVWAEIYEGNVRDILGLQQEVGHAIARQIVTTLRPTVAIRLRSIDPAVYDLYLRGRFFWNRRTEEDVRRAIEHFEEAIRKDPTYAPAFAGLADSYIILNQWSMPGATAWTKARAAADRALQLDDTLAEGHTSRAGIAMNGEWDWARADKEYRRALELNPGYATAHHWYGYYLMLTGRLAEAEVELKRAQELDPLSLIINANIGFRLYVARDHRAALAHWQKALEKDPNSSLLHAYKGLALLQLERYPEALATIQKSMDLSGAPPTLAVIAHTYAKMGRTDEARKVLASLHETSKKRFVPAFYISLVHLGLGEHDLAFRWLEKAYEERSGPMLELHADPIFDPLRADPRFTTLLRRIGLPG